MLDDFQISKITYDDGGVTNYWVTGDFHFECQVDSDAPVGDILFSYYGNDFDRYTTLLTAVLGAIHDDPLHEHHGSEILSFDKTGGRVALKHHMSWADQGITENFHVVRHTPARFKPASAA